MAGLRDEVLGLQTAAWKQSRRGAPHEYILSRDYPLLVAIVQQKVKSEGKVMSINGYTRVYWEHLGHAYWVLPGISALPPTLVLNRVMLVFRAEVERSP